VSHQIIRIFDASGSPQWTTIQGGAQGSWAKRLTLAGNLNGSFDEPSIHLRLDEKLPKSHQRAFDSTALARCPDNPAPTASVDP
jgi:hypothetical protein